MFRNVSDFDGTKKKKKITQTSKTITPERPSFFAYLRRYYFLLCVLFSSAVTYFTFTQSHLSIVYQRSIHTRTYGLSCSVYFLSPFFPIKTSLIFFVTKSKRKNNNLTFIAFRQRRYVYLFSRRRGTNNDRVGPWRSEVMYTIRVMSVHTGQ